MGLPIAIPSGNFTPGALAAVSASIDIINSTWELAGTIRAESATANTAVGTAVDAAIAAVDLRTVPDVVLPNDYPVFTDFVTDTTAYDPVVSTAVTATGMTAPDAVAFSAIASASVTEPTVTIADVDTVDVFAEFETEYKELIAELASKFVAFQGTYFPQDSALYTKVGDWLSDAFGTDGGIPATVQASIWGSDQARVLSDASRAKDAVLTTFAARRFPLPPGAAASAILQIDQKAQSELAESSRKIAALSVEQYRFAVDKALAARQLCMSTALDYIKALSVSPDISSRLVGVGYDAQSKMISAASGFLNARTEVAKMLNQVQEFNASTAMDSTYKNASIGMDYDHKKALAELDATFKTQQGSIDATHKNQMTGVQMLDKSLQAELQIKLKEMDHKFGASMENQKSKIAAENANIQTTLQYNELKIKAMLADLQSMSQQATALLNNLQADAGLRYSVSA